VAQTFKSADLIASMRAHLKSRLPPYMIPAAFMLLDVFP